MQSQISNFISFLPGKLLSVKGFKNLIQSLVTAKISDLLIFTRNFDNKL